MKATAAVFILAMIITFYGARKVIYRALKRAAKRQAIKAGKASRRGAGIVWTATKVGVARRTIG